MRDVAREVMSFCTIATYWLSVQKVSAVAVPLRCRKLYKALRLRSLGLLESHPSRMIWVVSSPVLEVVWVV
jgi:hypothetical protein